MPAESVPAIPIPTPTPAPAPASAAVEPRGLEELQQPREVQPPFVADVVEPVYLPMTLTVGAGFKFGCGVLLAIAFAALALFLLFSVIFFVATLMGIPLPVGGT